MSGRANRTADVDFEMNIEVESSGVSDYFHGAMNHLMATRL